MDRYSSNPNNAFPQKLHLAEMNPSIARLPASFYRSNDRWLRETLVDTKKSSAESSLPIYLASYRVTHLNKCFSNRDDFRIFYANGTDSGEFRRKRTDYLGFALLDARRNILADTVLEMHTGVFGYSYQDYRLFNLKGGGEDGIGEEELYLSTERDIAPIRVSMGVNANTDDGFKEFSPAFRSSSSSSKQPHRHRFSFRVSVRGYKSCFPNPDFQNSRVSIKNLLYFNEPNTNKNANGLTAAVTTSALFQPHGNPNLAYHVRLDKKCNSSIVKTPEYYTRAQNYTRHVSSNPKPSFENIEAELFPGRNDLFLVDRGSACCTRIKAHEILGTKETRNHNNENDNENDNDKHETDYENDEDLLVAIVHPKTPYPGKRLPKEVRPNTYLSRFIAFLPREPYTIMAISGKFCFGYPAEKELGHHHQQQQQQQNNNAMNTPEYVHYLRMGTMEMNCPRIHFTTGMVDKANISEIMKHFANEDGKEDISNHDHDRNDAEEDAVIVGFGVSDCLARFAEVMKSDIIDMLRVRQE
eukprot:jgi/Psemu1/262503/estExt_Genewise1Plus.C_7820019